MIIAWLLIACICYGLIYYVDRPTTRGDTLKSVALSLGWPAAIPFLLGYEAVEKLRENA